MSLSSFSLQSSQAFSDPRWGTWTDLILVCSWQVLSGVLAGVLGRDPSDGVRSRKLITWCFEGIRKRKC